jgi:plastocyanin
LSTQFKALAAVAVLMLSLTAVAGCGGGSNNSSSSSSTTSTTDTTTAPAKTTPSGGGGATTLKVDADPSGALKFTKSSLSAKAGKVTVDMDNPSPVQHGVGIKGNGIQQVGNAVGKGGVSTVTANLKAGTYEFYCPVDAHEQAGMKGTLTVK